MAKVKTLRDTDGSKIYPRTASTAITVPGGGSLEQHIQNLIDADSAKAEAGREQRFVAKELERQATFDAKETTRDAANQAALDAAETLAEQGEKLSELESKTEDIAKEVIETEEDPIIIEDNNGNEVFHLDENGLDAKNVKSNGKEVLTEHQPLDEYAKKTELPNGVKNENTSDSDSFITFENSKGESFLKIEDNLLDFTGTLNVNGKKIAAPSEKVSDGVNLVDLHFEVKAILGRTFQTLVDYKDQCIYSSDYDALYEAKALAGNDMSDSANLPAIVYNKNNTLTISATDATVGNYYLAKTNARLLSMSRYIKVHVKSFNGDFSIGTYYTGPNKQTYKSHHYIFSLSKNGELFAQHGEDKSSTNPSYFKTSKADDWSMPAGEFDLYYCKSGDAVDVYIDYGDGIKEVAVFSCGDPDLRNEAYELSYMCFGVKATDGNPFVTVSDVEVGFWSGLANGTDCKCVRYKNGEVYRDAEGNIFVCSTHHGNDNYSFTGGTNIFKVNIRSHKVELVGMLDGHYVFDLLDIDKQKWLIENPTKTESDFISRYSKWKGIDIKCNIHSTCIIRDDDRWLISGSVFSNPMDRILVQAELDVNPLYGFNSLACNRVKGMTLSDYDLDTLYDGEKWIGICGGGSKWHCDSYFGTWVKDAESNTFEGSMFALVNGKIFYTSSPARNTTMNVYDYASHTQVGVANFDKFASTGNTVTITPTWGHIFGICENNITRYYAIIFSTRKYRRTNFGYGDMWIYEAKETVKGIEKIY